MNVSIKLDNPTQEVIDSLLNAAVQSAPTGEWIHLSLEVTYDKSTKGDE